MGYPPPPDQPSPADQASADASAGFEPSPSGPSLCGFGLPSFRFQLSFHVPQFPPFGFPPKFNFFIGLNCDLSDPFEAHVEFGGGRVGTGDSPDEDPEYGTF